MRMSFRFVHKFLLTNTFLNLDKFFIANQGILICFLIIAHFKSQNFESKHGSDILSNMRYVSLKLEMLNLVTKLILYYKYVSTTNRKQVVFELRKKQ